MPERGLGLFDEKIDDVARALLAKRAETPQKGFAGKGGGGAERIGADDIGAAADAGIHHHGGAIAGLRTMAGSASIAAGKASIWRPP